MGQRGNILCCALEQLFSIPNKRSLAVKLFNFAYWTDKKEVERIFKTSTLACMLWYKFTMFFPVQEGIKSAAFKVRKGAKIRNRYNQAPHLTQDTTWVSDKTQLNITNKRQEVSPFPAGDHKAAMNSRESMTNTRYK